MVQKVTVNGSVYSDGSNDGGAGELYLANGGHRSNFIPMITDTIVEIDAGVAAVLGAAGDRFKATSSTSLLISVASKTLTLDQADRSWTIGSEVKLTSSANTTNYMIGVVTAYTSPSITVSATSIGGSGTLADWAISTYVQGGLTSVIDDLTPQLGGDLDTNGKTFGVSSYAQIADASPSTGTTHTFAFASGDYQKITCPAAGTLTLGTSGFVSGKVCSMIVELTNGGDCTIIYPAAWKFATGTTPTLTVAGTDSLVLVKDSSDVYSMYILGLNVTTA